MESKLQRLTRIVQLQFFLIIVFSLLAIAGWYAPSPGPVAGTQFTLVSDNGKTLAELRMVGKQPSLILYGSTNNRTTETEIAPGLIRVDATNPNSSSYLTPAGITKSGAGR